MKDFKQSLSDFSAGFNRRLEQFFTFPQGFEQQAARAMYYSLSNGGKRLRPFLIYQTASLFDVAPAVVLPVAVSLEMLHTYSLIHDDLPAMDNDDFRRGKPTCHKQFDEATAILAGDGLLTYAFEVLAKAPDIPEAVRLRLIALLAERAGAFNGMIAGQMLDLRTDKTPELSSEQVIKHIEEMKTGCLIAYAAQAGAILGNAPAESYEQITAYARKIGIAFQISDDILDMTGDSAVVGKTLGKDKAQNKLTFVSLYGLDEARIIAARLIDEAKDCLAAFDDKADRLRQLADFIISRNY